MVLLTGGQERILAPRLVDALAWQLGATSVLCSDAGGDAPGGFNQDLTPNMSDPANVRYMRQESYPKPSPNPYPNPVPNPNPDPNQAESASCLTMGHRCFARRQR